MSRKSRQRKTRRSLKSRRRTRKYRGGGDVPFPKGSITFARLDPEGPLEMVSKEFADKELFND